jgi:hypothetical protein
MATQNHLQAKMLFWLDFLCDNLVHPCNTPGSIPGSFNPSKRRLLSRRLALTTEELSA